MALARPNAQISCDRHHVVAMANEAMDKVREAELRDEPQAVANALGTSERKTIKGLMHRLQHPGLKSARAWRLKMALCAVFARAAASNDPHSARADLNVWLSWARRCRLDLLRKLAKTISERADAVVRGLADNRSNAFVEAMNGLLQQAKRAARGFRTATSFIAIAYLRMSNLKHLPAHPFSPAAAK